MNMFDRTRAFVPYHFIHHYTVNYYSLLINAKKQNSAVHWKRHDLNPISLHAMRAQCKRQETP